MAEQGLTRGEALLAVGARVGRSGWRAGSEEAVSCAQVQPLLVQRVAVEAGTGAEGTREARARVLLEVAVHVGLETAQEHRLRAVGAQMALGVLKRERERERSFREQRAPTTFNPHLLMDGAHVFDELGDLPTGERGLLGAAGAHEAAVRVLQAPHQRKVSRELGLL